MFGNCSQDVYIETNDLTIVVFEINGGNVASVPTIKVSALAVGVEAVAAGAEAAGLSAAGAALFEDCVLSPQAVNANKQETNKAVFFMNKTSLCCVKENMLLLTSSLKEILPYIWKMAAAWYKY